MKKLFLITLVFAFLSTITTMAQVNYYVSTIGSDFPGDGTQSNPWLTIEYAVNTVSNPTTATIVINVEAGTYTLNSNDIYINRGFTNLTIQGAGAGTTIVEAATTEGSATNRVFYVRGSSQTVTLKGITIRNGKQTFQDGGGIFVYDSKLNVTDCIISGNVISGGSGGGIMNSYNSTLTITNCTISGNTSNRSAGGIRNDLNSTITMTNCTISGNTASLSGGGFDNWDGSTIKITNCTISGNTASQKGGGIYNQSNASFTSTNCTIANNTCGSSYNGGGLYNDGSFYVKNTILGNNQKSDGTTQDYYYGSGYLYSNGYNICETGDDYIEFNGTGDIRGEQANLNLSATLASNNTTNGTYTLKTTSSSVAINAGTSSGTNNSVTIPTQDQRGAERNGAADIGAYEYWADDAPLPVELASFSASVVSGKVFLSWSTATEVNNYGFEIFRLAQNGKWEIIGFVQGHGNSNSLKDYTFIDNTPPNGKIKYRLKQIDFNGVFEYSNEIETNNSLPTNFSLNQNYPNPFNPETTIEYTIPANVKGETIYVTLKVFDVLGREVATLVDEFKQAGSYKVTFNVETRHGVSLPSGVYFYKLQSGSYSETKKLILMK
ncbi:MAG: right-handed parallel beta-helix repeat-containing protein [Melioribacteraceae bacterium]